MSPFEAMYGREYKTPVSWENPINRVVLGLETIKEMEKGMVKYNTKFESNPRWEEDLCKYEKSAYRS